MVGPHYLRAGQSGRPSGGKVVDGFRDLLGQFLRVPPVNHTLAHDLTYLGIHILGDSLELGICPLINKAHPL